MRRFDFAGYDTFGQLRALVEVKKRLGTDPNWAVHLRDGQLTRGALSPSLAFLLVVPEKAYFWPPQAPPGAAPQVLDLASHLAPYFQRIETSPLAIVPEAFEMLIGWWLNAPPHPDGVNPGWPEDLSHLQWEQEAAA